MDIAKRIKTVRGELSQDEFAQRVGVHKNSLGRYERGDSTPGMDFAEKVCSVFGVSPQWLLLGTGPVYDVTKTHLVHRRLGGGPDGLCCGDRLSDIELRPEYKEWVDRYEAQEARIAALEKELATTKAELAASVAAELQAKDEVIKAQNRTLQGLEKHVDALNKNFAEYLVQDVEKKGFRLPWDRLFEAVKECQSPADLEGLVDAGFLYSPEKLFEAVKTCDTPADFERLITRHGNSLLLTEDELQKRQRIKQAVEAMRPARPPVGDEGELHVELPLPQPGAPPPQNPSHIKK